MIGDSGIANAASGCIPIQGLQPLAHILVVSPDVPTLTLMSQFLLPRPPSFLGAKNLGIWEAAKDSSGVSSEKREKEDTFVGCIWRSLRIGTAFMQCCDTIGLQIWPSKDAASELGYSHCLCQHN